MIGQWKKGTLIFIFRLQPHLLHLNFSLSKFSHEEHILYLRVNSFFKFMIHLKLVVGYYIPQQTYCQSKL